MDGNLQKYQAFLKTIEYGSFTRAAEALAYTQSSVSKMIADLEASWQVKLLERDRNGVRLTSDGLQLLPHIRRLCEDFMQLADQVDLLNGVQTGIIRIGTFSSTATHWLPNIIKAFQRDYPNIEYELLLGDYTEIEKWILQGRVDCGFLPLPIDSELEVLPLEKDELVVVLPEDHPLAEKSRIDPQDLNGQPFMLQEHGGKTGVSQLLERYDIKPRIRFTTWDDYAIMSMVEGGLGISILPQLILKRIPYRIAIRSLSVPAFREIGLALRSQESAPAAVRRFMQYLNYR